MVRSISTIEELEEQLRIASSSGKLVVLDFFAKWCGPCVRAAPTIEQWSKEDFKDTVVFLKCNVDEAEALTRTFKIEAMPTFVFFKNTQEIYRMLGADMNQLRINIINRSK